MTNGGPEIFGSVAATYEDQRRRLVPHYEAFYDAAVAALALSDRPMRHVLDLGAGTGLLGRHVAAAHPGVALTLLDGSPAMLEQARAALGSAARYVAQDLAATLPRGPWDAIVSALAIHHLADEAKRDLFARIHAQLAPGAVFVNAEQVAGPTDFLHGVYERWHARMAAQLGTTAEQWAVAEERMQLDRCATVERQLGWLREAGFSDADCLFKRYRFAVLVARRAS